MNGIILVDKPEGWTSNDVVCKLKGVLHERRIGHSGTLDPMATGLLPVFIGRATRAIQFAESDSKTYIAGLKLGITTDTLDITGNVLSSFDTAVDVSEVKECLEAFIGKQKQLPPMYSAIKINGQKLYNLARKGLEIERTPRDIEVFELSILDICSNHEYMIKVDCSKGTYIRSLCDDIGRSLGCGGCMSSLRRIRCGQFSIENSVKLDQLISMSEKNIENVLMPVDSLFSDYPKIAVNEKQLFHIYNGSSFSASISDGLYRFYSPSSEFLMIGKANDGVVKLIKNFF